MESGPRKRAVFEWACAAIDFARDPLVNRLISSSSFVLLSSNGRLQPPGGMADGLARARQMQHARSLEGLAPRPRRSMPFESRTGPENIGMDAWRVASRGTQEPFEMF